MKPKLVLENARKEGLAFTFDDVLLKTGLSEVLPEDINLESMFSRNVGLKIPIVSAAMDTVTEFGLAIELAKLGGIGVIHRGLSAEEQKSQVARVKHHLNGLIERPIYVNQNDTVSSVLLMRDDKDFTFHSFPVRDNDGKLVGILTRNDFEFCKDNSLTVRDIMSTDLLTAQEGTKLEEAYDLMIDRKKKILPLLNDDGEISGMYVFSDVKRIMTDSAKTHNVDDRGQLRVAAAIGVGEDALRRIELLDKENLDVAVMDTAHGDSKGVYDTLREIKRNYSLDVVVGNISEGTSIKRLVDEGADGAKIGQGPGGSCSTRIIAGTGCPQVSAIYNSFRELIEMNLDYDIPICADGGLKNSGDITKAIAAGAKSVMMGSMLAGTDEAPGDVVFFIGRSWKDYRGMGSLGAMETNKDARDRYLQVEDERLIPEGMEGLIPYRGKLADAVHQYIGGLRKGMGYIGATTIEELREKGDFYRITAAGVSESHPHGMRITKESPNYKGDD